MSKGKHHNYLRYTSIGFELVGSLLLFVFIGYSLDKRVGTEKPWFMLVFSLIGCGVAMYLMIRRINQIK